MLPNKKQNNWLRSELPKWESDGLISDEQRLAFESRYPKYESRQMAPYVLLILGVLSIITGVIVLFSHNWENLDRPARAAIVFTYQTIGVCLAGFVLWKNKSKIWREVSGLVLNLTLLGSMAIIGQTYQMGGSLESLLFAWLLLSVSTCYIMRSGLCTKMYLVGSLVWLMTYLESHNGVGFWSVLLILLAVKLPVLWLEIKGWHNYLTTGKSRVLVLLSAISSLAFCLALISVFSHGALTTSLFVFVFTLLTIVASRVHEKFGFLLITNPLAYLGSVILFGSMVALSQLDRSLSTEFYRYCDTMQDFMVFRWVILFIFPLVLLTVLVIRKSSFFYLLLSLYPVFQLVGFYFYQSLIYLLVFNLYVVSLCVLLIINGEGQKSIYQVLAGSFGIAILLLSHLFSGDAPLVVKGLSFIAIGVVFVVVNLLMIKRISKMKGVRSEA